MIKMEQGKKYLSAYDEKYNSALLSLFKSLIDILEQNGLQYWTCGGTTLGAVRHQGLIPWDDDIDIYMPRKDYDAFLEIAEKRLPAGYGIVSLKDKGYFLPYAKFVNTNTTLWEYAEYPFIIGVFIDIFPLDNANGRRREILSHKSDCIKNIGKFKLCINEKTAFQFLKEGHYLAFLYKVLYSHKGKESKYLAKYEDIVKKYSTGSGWAALCWSQATGILFERSWFDEYVSLPFNGLNVRVPKGYDEYLTCRYGDYMKLPPEDQRVPCHERYYVNLEEGLTLEEVKERIKQGEYQK